MVENLKRFGAVLASPIRAASLVDIQRPRFALVFFFFFFNIYFIDFLQRGRERDRELETSMREKHRSAASCTSPTGDVPATQVHALDRNRTWDLSVRRPTLYPLSQTGFGCTSFYYIIWTLVLGVILMTIIQSRPMLIPLHPLALLILTTIL
uniref:Uncharacterized protein n=1 Tax=Myotis myotis TaxID=51298 RepID=A0A7J7U5E5_MYOMY|nr:hypothetical protein mMyoMyo1_008846 [Myotis myotis]